LGFVVLAVKRGRFAVCKERTGILFSSKRFQYEHIIAAAASKENAFDQQLRKIANFLRLANRHSCPFRPLSRNTETLLKVVRVSRLARQSGLAASDNHFATLHRRRLNHDAGSLSLTSPIS